MNLVRRLVRLVLYVLVVDLVLRLLSKNLLAVPRQTSQHPTPLGALKGPAPTPPGTPLFSGVFEVPSINTSSRPNASLKEQVTRLRSDESPQTAHNTDVEVLTLSELLSQQAQAKWVTYFFSLEAVAAAMVDSSVVANRSTILSRGPPQPPLVSFTVANAPQICILDNFISHLSRLEPQRRGLVFPPFLIFTLDQATQSFCEQLLDARPIEKRTLEGHLSLRCVAPLGSVASSPRSIDFGDPAYRVAVWMKPMLLALMLSSNMFSALLTDIDIVVLKPWISIPSAASLELACEVDGDLLTGNTGFILATQSARTLKLVKSWATIARFPPPADDQASFRARIARAHPDALKCFAANFLQLGCKCASPCTAFAVHCTESPNKTRDLDALGFWAPILTSHGDCRYGVSDQWWKTHPKQLQERGGRFGVQR